MVYRLIVSFALGALAASCAAAGLFTRRHRRERNRWRQLLKRTRRAEKLAELGTLTGHLAHEIRNPLSIIKVNLQLLSENIQRMIETIGDIDDLSQLDKLTQQFKRQLRKIETITREADRLSNTLNDFMRYAGRMEMHPVLYDINEIVDDLIDFYTPQAVRHNIRILSSLHPEPVMCNVDVDLLKQAILNLFINATQVMDEGGELIVRTDVQPPSVFLEIADTGPGIPPEEQEKIFDPYYTTRSGGSGLGLPTCRRIVEEHGGHIDLHSEVGKGSRFRIELPLAPDS